MKAGNGSTEKVLKHIFIKFKHYKHALGEEWAVLTEQTSWSQRHRRRHMTLGGDSFYAVGHSLV